MEKFNTDFNYFWDLIEKNKNFAFARYGDGEVMLMKGISISELTQAFQIDRWQAPNKLTKMGKELLETLNHIEDDYFYAIPSKTDNIEASSYLKNNIAQKENNLTLANLWVNANYHNMKQKLNNLKRDVILVCNHRANKENFPFKVTDITPFPDDCVNFWESNGNIFIKELINRYKDFNDKLFLISCGPVSEIIIHNLYLANRNNTYIDVGSSIDEFVHQKITRPYMDPRSAYHNMISSFEVQEKLGLLSLKKWVSSFFRKFL